MSTLKCMMKKLTKRQEEAKPKWRHEHEQRIAEKEQQKKQSSGVRTRGRHRNRGGEIWTHGGKRNWLYIPPEESSTKEEVEQDEEDWECKACSEDDGVANDFLGLFTMWHLRSVVPHPLCKQKCWWFFSVPVLSAKTLLYWKRSATFLFTQLMIFS